jgi:cytochrome c556
MKRWIVVAAVVGLVGLVGLAGAQDDKPLTIKQTMGKLHKGATAPVPSLKKALAGDSPNWKAVQTNTKTIVTLSESLPKNDPPKGAKANYEKLAKAYVTNAVALNDAATKENLSEAKTAYGKITGSCMTCHMAHRP